MNFIKASEIKGKPFKHRQTEFIPILSLLHAITSAVIQGDKYIYPVVLYEYYLLICIFMKIQKKIKTKL